MLVRVAAVVAVACSFFVDIPVAEAGNSTKNTSVVVRVSDVRVLGELGDVERAVAHDTFVVRPDPDASFDRPEVRWAAPDTTYRSARVPNDVCFLTCPASPDGQSELRALGAIEAWDISTGSAGITVAVLDTPADLSHPDLRGKVRAGANFVTSACARPSVEEASHGTAVAGLIGANTGNGEGIAALGWDTQVLSVAVLDGCGIGTASGIASGIRHAADAGARIINLSLNGAPHPALADAVAYARSRGALVVAAAGNDGGDAPTYPAAYPGVLAVAAADDAGTRVSTFSRRGSWVDLAAPGEAVVTTTTPGGGYLRYSGTSFAAPLVAASAALVLARHPDWDGDDLAVRLTRTAKPLVGTTAGFLQVVEALTERPGGVLLAGSDGSVYAFGDAEFRGSAARVTRLPIVGIAARPAGYWLVASDGGVFAYGEARFFGSTGAIRLARPIVGMASTPSGQGYWLVASDGGVFAFGDARFAGSTGAIALASPIVGMAPAGPSAYWMVAADGGVFAFGGAPYHGSAAGQGRRIRGMAVSPGARGYWLATDDGEPIAFGQAPDDGSVHPAPPAPVVGAASTSA